MLLASEKWDGLPWQVRELPLKRQILLNGGWNRGSLMIFRRMFVCMRVYVDVCVGVGFSDPATEPDWCWEDPTRDLGQGLAMSCSASLASPASVCTCQNL